MRLPLIANEGIRWFRIASFCQLENGKIIENKRDFQMGGNRQHRTEKGKTNEVSPAIALAL